MVRAKRRMLAVLMLASCGVAGACSSFSGDSDTTSPDAGEAGTLDATEAADRPDPVTDASTADVIPPLDAANLLENGDFELGCGAWTGTYASLTEDPVAHSGARSCRVCANNTVRFTLSQPLVQPIIPGDRYALEAWVHDAPDAAAPTTPLQVLLIVVAGGIEVQGPVSTGTAPSPAWQRLTSVITVNGDGGSELVVKVDSDDPGIPAFAPHCYLIDDVRLYHP